MAFFDRFNSEIDIDKMRDQKNFNGLLNALDNNDKNVRKESLKAIMELSKKGYFDNKIIDKLEELTSSSDKDLRAFSARALGNLAYLGECREESLKKLEKLFNDPNANVRAKSVFAVTEIIKKGYLNEEILEKLDDLLEDDNVEVKRNSASLATVLAENDIFNEENLDVLLELLNDGSKEVRQNTVRAIVEFTRKGFANERLFEKVVDLLNKEDSYPLKSGLARVLGNLAGYGYGNEEVISVLEDLMDSKNDSVRGEAIISVSKFAKEGIALESTLKILKEYLEDNKKFNSINKKEEISISKASEKAINNINKVLNK